MIVEYSNDMDGIYENIEKYISVIAPTIHPPDLLDSSGDKSYRYSLWRFQKIICSLFP